MIAFLITLYITIASLENVSSQIVTPECARAICHQATDCQGNGSCTDESCGPFAIAKRYWVSSEVWKLSASNYSSISFESCARNYACASRTVRLYLTKVAEDCNGDGVVDCTDFWWLHFNGGCVKTSDMPEFVLLLPRSNFSTSTFIPRFVIPTKPAPPENTDSTTDNSSSVVNVIAGSALALVLVGLIVSVVVAWRWTLCCFAPKATSRVSVSFDPGPLRVETDMDGNPILHQERMVESYLEPIKFIQVEPDVSSRAVTACHTFNSKLAPIKPMVSTGGPFYENFMVATENQGKKLINKVDDEYLEVLELENPSLYSNVISDKVEPSPAPASAHLDYDYVYSWQFPLKY